MSGRKTEVVYPVKIVEVFKGNLSTRNYIHNAVWYYVFVEHFIVNISIINIIYVKFGCKMRFSKHTVCSIQNLRKL